MQNPKKGAPQRGKNWISVRCRNHGSQAVAFAAVVARIHPQVCFDPAGIDLMSVYTGASVQPGWSAGEERRVQIPIDVPEALSSATAVSVQFLAQRLNQADGKSVFSTVAWKSVIPIDGFAGSESRLSFFVSNRHAAEQQSLLLELRRPSDATMIETLIYSSGGLPLNEPATEPVTEYIFPPSERAPLMLELAPESFRQLDVVVRLPDDTASERQFRFDVVAIRPEDSELIGGFRMLLNVL